MTCGSAERVTGLAGADDGVGRAARTLGVGPARVEPEPQRDADRRRPRAVERDGAVDAAAHRDRDATRGGRGARDAGPSALATRIRGQRLAGHGRRLEQRQPDERARHPRRVGLDDPVAVHDEPRTRVRVAARGVTDELERPCEPG